MDYLMEQALKRPLDYDSLSPHDQWEIDRRLGILDWDPTPEESREYMWLRGTVVPLHPIQVESDVPHAVLVNQLAKQGRDAERLMALGLPGCLAIGHIPGSRPGLLRPADIYHKALVKALLEHLPNG